MGTRCVLTLAGGGGVVSPRASRPAAAARTGSSARLFMAGTLYVVRGRRARRVGRESVIVPDRPAKATGLWTNRGGRVVVGVRWWRLRPYFRAARTRCSTASPLNGALNCRRAPPATGAVLAALPVAASCQPTANSPGAFDTSTVTAPPSGRYTRYSDPGFARQNFVDARSPRGVMAARFTFSAKRRASPRARRTSSAFLGTGSHADGSRYGSIQSGLCPRRKLFHTQSRPPPTPQMWSVSRR